MTQTEITENTRAEYKKLSSARREYISNSVAIGWLLNAEKVIARGASPMKLSVVARDQIKDMLSQLPETILLPSSSGITRMENNCLRFALYLLRNGRYPSVAQHFTTTKVIKNTKMSFAQIGEDILKGNDGSGKPEVRSY